MKLDITTGDKITPHEVDYDFKLMFENRCISVLAYNFETIMAEKLETLISRGSQNTRLRDYYDVYILAKFNDTRINMQILSAALFRTARYRGTETLMMQYKNIIEHVAGDETMQLQWTNYQKAFEYASGIEFSDVCSCMIQIMDEINYYENLRETGVPSVV